MGIWLEEKVMNLKRQTEASAAIKCKLTGINIIVFGDRLKILCVLS